MKFFNVCLNVQMIHIWPTCYNVRKAELCVLRNIVFYMEICEEKTRCDLCIALKVAL